MIGSSCMIHILAFHGHATQNYLKSKTLSYHAAQTKDDHVMLTVRTGKKKDYPQALTILTPLLASSLWLTRQQFRHLGGGTCGGVPCKKRDPIFLFSEGKPRFLSPKLMQNEKTMTHLITYSRKSNAQERGVKKFKKFLFFFQHSIFFTHYSNITSKPKKNNIQHPCLKSDRRSGYSPFRPTEHAPQFSLSELLCLNERHL
jgi:hypothetical protein